MIARNKVVLGLLLSSVFLLSLFIPQVPAVAPLWRLISPTEYTSFPKATMHGVYMLNGGTSGKGSGNGWMVGDQGLVFQWDGFSWEQSALGPVTPCQLNSVNFGGPLNPLTGITSSSGWLVGGVHAGGSGGGCTGPVAYFYNGVGWTSYSSGLSSYGSGELRGVFLVNGGSSGTSIQAFAVGAENGGLDGSFFDWNGVPGVGGGWTHLQTAAGTPMNSVYMTHCIGSNPCSADDGIAVGNNGVIFRWNGGSWSPLSTPVSGTNLNGVAMASQTRGWAVGDSCTIIQTSDGTTWMGAVSPSICGSPIILRSIVLTSSSEAWVVGDQVSGSGVATIIHGTSLDSSPNWVKIPDPQVSAEPSLNAVTFASSGGNIWAAGNAGVAAFCLSNCGSSSGAIWSTTTAPRLVDMNSVFMSSDSDGFAVGNLDSIGNPTILRWDGGTYSWRRAPFVSPITNAPLYGIFQSSGSAGWAVGGTGAGVPSTFWYDGNTWTGRAVACTGTCQFQFRSVYMVSDSNSWAVGGFPTGTHVGVLAHSTGSGVQFGSAPLASALGSIDLYSVYFDPSSGGQSGWIVGGNGGSGSPVVAHTTNGGSDGWGIIINNPGGVPNGVILKSLFMQDGSHGWAAGTGSTILYWNGASWTQMGVTINAPYAGPIDIRGIFLLGGTPATDGYAVGVDNNNLPVVIHYDGSSWSTFPSPAIPNTGQLNGLSLRSSTNGLAVGTQVSGDTGTLGLIVHLDPPGGVTASNNGNPQSQTQQQQQTTATGTSSSTETQSSASGATSTASGSTTVSTSSSHTTNIVTGQVSSTATSQTQAVTSSMETPVAMPGIPGFPWESIVLGIIVGLGVLGIIRRRRRAADR